jgi:hypothetical protein
MSAFSIKEKEDDLSGEFANVSGATAFLLRGTEGRVTSLWDGARTRSLGMAEGIADGLPTTVVASAGALLKERVDTWLEATLLPLPLPFADPTSLTITGRIGCSYFFGSSSSSITSGALETRLL